VLFRSGKMTKKIMTVALAALFCGGALYAQRGSFGPGPRMQGAQAAQAVQADQLKTYLSLTDQQVLDLKAVQSALRTASEPIMLKIGEKSKALRDAMQANPVDAALVAQLKTDLENLNQQEQGLRSQYRLQAQNLLTADQKTKLVALQKAIELMPTANQAAFLNLLDTPQGFRGGPGGPGMGGGRRGPGGQGPEAFIRP